MIIIKQLLYVVAGPTACGKTSVSIELAKQINGEIISADSMQIYKFMDIGTAKVTREEMCGIKHHLIDELNPDEPFSVATFCEMAKSRLEEIYAKGKTPIIVGGTGFYINALINANQFKQEENDHIYRNELAQIAEEKGNRFLHNMLKEIDTISAENIHENNVKRVIRAIEFAKFNDITMSQHNEIERVKESDYNVKFIVLNDEREKLYSRIDKRVDEMIANGLVGEVENLLNMGYGEILVSMNGLGYKEIVPYIKGETTLEEAVTLLKRDTRHFAKRQLTWFKHQCDGVWVNVSEFAHAIEIAKYIKGV